MIRRLLLRSTGLPRRRATAAVTVLLLWPAGCDCFCGGGGGGGDFNCAPTFDYDSGSYDSGPPRTRYGDCAETECAQECASSGMFGECRWSGTTLDCRCFVDPPVDCDPEECAPRCAALGYDWWTCSHVGCRCYNSAPPSDAGGDDDGDAGDDVATDATDDGGECGPPSCSNDPISGPVGMPCTIDDDCLDGLECRSAYVETVADRTYVDWAGGYCAWWWRGGDCTLDGGGICPLGSYCLQLPASSGGAFACLDACAIASPEGTPWPTRCDCREGYRCDLVAEACLPGCSNDPECCEVWHDGAGGPADGLRQEGELEDLPPAECADTCDPCTSACARHGCPGGACRVGDPCRHDSGCPADGRCLTAAPDDGSPLAGGMCVIERCDLTGRECPVGAACGLLPDPYGRPEPVPTCLVPCTAAALPGATDNPCRDGGVPGTGDPGDDACRPVPDGFWRDGAIADGFCWPGEFPGGTTPLGGTCTAAADCTSPGGLGACIDLDGSTVPTCTAPCNERLAREGFCGAADATGGATGACLDAHCRAACDGPERILGSNGCADPVLACYSWWRFGGAAAIVVGATSPRGLCLAPCTSDEDCAARWGAASTCNTLNGVCTPG